MSSDKSQFEIGFQPKVQQQPWPGKQSDLDPHPIDVYLPSDENGGKELYKAAGKLKGKNVIITGGDSGIGRATAIMYSMEGAANIMIVYLPQEEEDAQNTKKDAEKYGAKVHTLALDLTTREACKQVADTAIKEFGHVHILINNHAVQMVRANIEELPEDQWDLTFRTNIHPFFYLSKYIIPQMGYGDSIINCASVNAYIGRPDLLDYTSTKGAIVAFSRGLSNQYCSKGIRCNAVAPGPVWTPLVTATMSKEALAQFTSPIGRPSQPSEIATCFVFLASKDSSSITGQTLHPNGGVVVNG